MSSSPAPATAPTKSSLWQSFQGLALLTPILAIVWMAFMTKLNGRRIEIGSPYFNNFWIWEALALFCAAWGLGLLTRILRPIPAGSAFRRPVLFAFFLLAAGIAAYAGWAKMSQMIVVAAGTLAIGVIFYLGSIQMERQERVPQQLTIMVSAFLGAASWMGLAFEGQSPLGIMAKGWMAMGCFAGVWLAIKNPNMTRPMLKLPQSVIGGYLFAAGISLARGIWSGDVAQIFAGDQTLLLTMAVGLILWVRHYAKLEKGAERDLLTRLIPLTLCVGLGLLYPLWMFSSPPGRLFCIALAITLVTTLTVLGFLKKLSPDWVERLLFVALLSPLAVIGFA
jgi:hypothetical protein